MRVSISLSTGERSEIGVYCGDKRPPTLMSGDSGSLHVTLTSHSPTAAAAAATRTGFTANYSFVTGKTPKISLLLPLPLLFTIRKSRLIAGDDCI